ncbi:phosphoribosylformylglycinamidine synthase subunit PurS [Acuticoccus sp. MNP-M23]|uniref:phosphoribosylformylglycinamidine synthase subunit PurS n=1 Tax=Acuticoccus sp. MNP-M23 TaxID=3072793 RepID=UPI002815C7A6|nr:phosphoribosylformylglycinamidine synthase subunit PurS [Acuticoccus sp. MNP-M23]WMS42112.1 phosphoribosylformylglycinamidine synthase subunit PurS [Acuticoccus sp. MNP-M23]
MRARVTITLKSGVLDPQGKAIEGALSGLGFAGVESARQGKVIDLELSASDPVAAEAEVAKMCEALLANTVVERYDIAIEG